MKKKAKTGNKRKKKTNSMATKYQKGRVLDTPKNYYKKL